MGMDFLDITLRLEKALNIKFDWKDFVGQIDPQRRDIIVGDLHRYVTSEFEKQRVGSPKKPIWCVRCGAEYSWVPAGGFCRVCGISMSAREQVWTELVIVLMESLNVDPVKIKPTAGLVRDLGASI